MMKKFCLKHDRFSILELDSLSDIDTIRNNGQIQYLYRADIIFIRNSVGVRLYKCRFSPEYSVSIKSFLSIIKRNYSEKEYQEIAEIFRNVSSRKERIKNLNL